MYDNKGPVDQQEEKPETSTPELIEESSSSLYDVRFFFPSDMQTANIFIDGIEPPLVERHLLFANVQLPKGRHTISLKGKRICEMTIYVTPNNVSFYPCR